MLDVPVTLNYIEWTEVFMYMDMGADEVVAGGRLNDTYLELRTRMQDAVYSAVGKSAAKEFLPTP